MEVFSGADQHDQYVQWITENREDGYVLNDDSANTGMRGIKLHLAKCGDIGGTRNLPPNGEYWTTSPKYCSVDAAELRAVAARLLANPRELRCGHCRP